MTKQPTQESKGCLRLAMYLPAIALVLWGLGLVIDSHVNFDSLTFKPIGVANGFAWLYGGALVVIGGIVALVTRVTISFASRRKSAKN